MPGLSENQVRFLKRLFDSSSTSIHALEKVIISLENEDGDWNFPLFLWNSFRPILQLIDKDLRCYSSFLFAPALFRQSDLLLVSATANKDHLFANQRFRLDSSYDVGPFAEAKLCILPLRNHTEGQTPELGGILMMFIDGDAQQFVTHNDEILILLSRKLDEMLKQIYLTVDALEGHFNQDMNRLQNLQHDQVKLITHNFIAPIQTVKIYLELLSEFAKGPSAEEYLTVVTNQTKMIEEQAKNLTQLPKIATAKSGELSFIDAPKERARTAEIFASAISELQSLADSKKLRIALRMQSAPNLSIDPQHFRDVLINLMSNAIKYSFAGTTITIDFRRVKRDVYFRFINYGIEIPFLKRERIFRLGYRTEKAKRIQVTASGMGLYIARQIIRQYGWEVYVEDSIFEKEIDEGRMFKNTFLILASMDILTDVIQGL